MSSGVVAAHSVIDAFGAGGSDGAWRLDRADIVERLHQLVEAPDAIRQGQLNLCGPAALFRVWLRRDPVAAVTYATTLFEQGRSAIGSLPVRPSGNLRQMWYGRTERGASCPQADWMMMAALRDSTNRMLRYSRQGGPVEAAAAITMPGALLSWLTATGLFSVVRNETTLVWRKGIVHAAGLEPAADRELFLLVALEMFRRPPSVLHRARDHIVSMVPNHWVVLTGPVVNADGAVALRFWSWGGEHTAVLRESQFRRCYHGSVVAVK